MRKKNQKIKRKMTKLKLVLFLLEKKFKNLIRWIKLKTIKALTKALTKEQRKERNNQK